MELNFTTFLCIITISIYSLLVRWSVSLGSFSGANKPPMYGDYEAQRHWTEVIYNLPLSQWYVNSTDNDLLYWGLDYPPLTAFHSWLCGAVANSFNGEWIELHKSRGFTSTTHKLFMRYTVLIADAFIYIPAVLYYYLTCAGLKETKMQILSSAIMLLYPGLILIDHGHFQYNCISLGMTLWAIAFVCKRRDFFAAFAFVLAINYKQMSLYHAMPFFCYLLSTCFKGPQFWLWRLSKLGVVVILTFVACWFPFLQSWKVFTSVVTRIFPVARGLYEDKVANVWCSISVVLKLKDFLALPSQVKLCLGMTVIFLLPSSLDLLFRPTTQKFRLALVNSSLVFFLFSFQVHEKSILIPSMTVCLLFPKYPIPVTWFLQISTLSMWPLLVKDGLILQTIGTVLLFQLVVHYYTTTTQSAIVNRSSTCISYCCWLSMALGICLADCSLLVKPPARYPDIFPLGISIYCCAHYLGFLLYFHWLQLTSPAESKLQ